MSRINDALELSSQNWCAKISNTGALQGLAIKQANDWKTLDFRKDEYAGPRWYGEWDGQIQTITMQQTVSAHTPSCPIAPYRFDGRAGKLAFWLEYLELEGHLAVRAGIRNGGEQPFRPVKAGIRLGLDTYMEKYPDWNRKLFPTLLRCEKTHFWGYCMSPEGTILGMASPDPVASWSLNYNRSTYGDYGHRIYTLNLDFLNVLPLPARHPHQDELRPGEERTWTTFLVPVDGLADLKRKLATVCGAPLFDLDRLTVAQGEPVNLNVHTPVPVTISVGKNRHPVFTNFKSPPATAPIQGPLSLPDAPGIYRLTAATDSGKQSEALLCRRRPWSWYLQQARCESLRIPQKASTHNEAWLGLYTQWLARLHFPDPELDARAETVFHDIVPKMYDLEKGEGIYVKSRIPNTAYMAGVLVVKYRCTQDPADLEAAARLADSVISYQDASGAYMGNAGKGDHRVHYTAVAYPGKSIMELCLEEKRLARNDPAWQARYERHWLSVTAAMDDLVRQKDNIDTEGEITFEDGMISCSAAQLGFFALLHEDPVERRRYAGAALDILQRHRCLEQLLIPDCRMNGCSLRFWEAQYDVFMYPNMLNSPHGWTSWKTYATWYAYLLTGEESYLRDTMNTLGACMQVIDAGAGRLRWGFVPDPYVRADQFGYRPDWGVDLKAKRVFIEDPARPGCGEGHRQIVGEQYIDMISDVYPGWCCDNDVHEHFKCLEEVALTSAYVVERQNGSLEAWNARIEKASDTWHVYPAEPVVSAVHVNVRGARDVAAHFDGAAIVSRRCQGRQWLLSPNMRNPKPWQGEAGQV